jgi:hypothetical protein
MSKKKIPKVVSKINLKNSNEVMILDNSVYEFFQTDEYFVKIGFINQLRLHSSGCAVFQKAGIGEDGKVKTLTIYPHKLIAEKWLADQQTPEKNLVSAIDGNKLNCTLANLTWRTRAAASRQRKTTSPTGYTGVYREHGRYRALISFKGSTIHLGMFLTAEEAAEAYNQKSVELFGEDGKINVIRPKS